MRGNFGPVNLDFSGLGGFFDPSKIPTAGNLGRFGLGGFPAPVGLAPPSVIPAPPPAPPRPAPVAPKPTFTPPPLKYDRMGRPIVNKIPEPVLPSEFRATPPPPVTPRPQPVTPTPSPITSRPPAPVTPSRARPNRFQEEAEAARKAAQAEAARKAAEKAAQAEAARKAAEKAAADAAARKAKAEADRKAAIEAARKAKVAEERRAAEKSAKEAADRKAKAEAERKAAEAAAKERVAPKPAPVMPVGRAYTSVGSNLRSAYTPTAPIAPPPVGTAAKRGDKRAPGTKRPVAVTPLPTPVAPKPTPVIGSTAPPALKSRAPTPAPVTPPPVTSAPLPEGVQSGGRYYKNPVTGAPMYQPPMPKLPDGMMGAQVMPPPINLDTGKSERITLLDDKPTPVTPPATTAPKPTAVAPKPVDTSRASVVDSMIASRGKPVSAKSAIQSYKNTLLGAASKNVYDTVDDVDEVDDYYDRVFRNTVIDPLNPKEALDREMAMEIGGEGGGRNYYQAPKAKLSFTPDEYLSEVGGPEYLKGLKSGTGVDKDVVQSAFSTIANTGGADTAAALSSYYGFDVVPTTGTPSIRDFGGNYESHTNASQEQISEFQSLVKPILAETIPYIQATEGVGYQEALLEAYKRDPMLQSMYAKYGVQPIRQTKDGSTYLYDPMTFGEIRTKEVKDSSVKDALKVAAIVGLSVFGGGALAGTAAFGGGTSAAGSALAYGTTSAGITAATGGDTNDILKSFALGGIGGYAKGLDAVASNAALAAEGATAGSELALAAKAAADTADTFGKVVQGAKFVDAAIDGNVAGAAISLVGPKFTKAAMDKVGLDKEFLDGYNINQDDAVAGFVKTELELAKGTDFGDAIAKGFEEYIKEGGALAPNNMKTPEFIKKIGDVISETGSLIDDTFLQPAKGFVEGTVKVLGDVAEPVVDVIEDVAGAVVEKAPLIEDAVKATGAAVEDVVKPIVEPIIDAAPVVEDAVRAVGSTVDDVIIEPAKELVEEVAPVVEDVVKDVGSAVDDAVLQPAKEVIESVVEAIPKPSLPDIDLPSIDVDLPDLDIPLPDFDVPVPTPSLPPVSFRAPPPRIIQERSAELFELEDEPEDDIDALTAFLTGGAGMANGGAVRNSYGSLDELLRIVGGK